MINLKHKNLFALSTDIEGQYDLIPQGYEIIGTVTEDNIDFDYIDLLDGNNGGVDDTMYNDYTLVNRFMTFIFEDPEESFRSLLQREYLFWKHPSIVAKENEDDESWVNIMEEKYPNKPLPSEIKLIILQKN